MHAGGRPVVRIEEPEEETQDEYIQRLLDENAALEKKLEDLENPI